VPHSFQSGSSLSVLTRRAPWVALALMLVIPWAANAQKKRAARQPPKATVPAATPLEKLRDEYIKATKDYKASLEKLLPLYEKPFHAAEEHLAKSKELFEQGLISRKELEASERTVAEAKGKIDDVHKQMGAADTQMAEALVEVDTEKQVGKAGRVPKGGMVRTTSMIRYNGAGAWSLQQVGLVDSFFRQKFGRALPIAVLGQGAIHNRWRLDHHNAMDLSLNPDGIEGQATMEFLRSRGIPFSAFRQAIPGTATGPHIHVGAPSHRY
jgi:hypothetical protein